MKAVGVIPARYGSTRFPGKPLKIIAGKPLLAWVVEAAKKAKSLNEVIVATDHEEIASLARSLGVKVEMTDSSLPSGTDRVWAAVSKLDCDVVLNIQGDEPLLKAELLNKLVEVFQEQPEVEMATFARSFKSEEDLRSLNTAKVLVNAKSEAIYFSRLPIPYSRTSYSQSGEFRDIALKHIGIYGFTKGFLESFCARSADALERAEALEQLRALSMGAKIKVVKVDYESWGVDTPEDVKKVEAQLKSE